jgi:hypothetical protein
MEGEAVEELVLLFDDTIEHTDLLRRLGSSNRLFTLRFGSTQIEKHKKPVIR